MFRAALIGLAVGLVACPAPKPPKAAVDVAQPPELVHADCLTARLLDDGQSLKELPEGVKLEPGGGFAWERPGDQDGTTYFVGVSGESGVTIWPIQMVERWDYASGSIRIVDRADLTGDGQPELLIQWSRDYTTRPSMVGGALADHQVFRAVWDVSGQRLLSAVIVEATAADWAGPVCSEDCQQDPVDPEVAPLCAQCRPEEVHAIDRTVELDGRGLTVGPVSEIRRPLTAQPDAREFLEDDDDPSRCPEGRYVWTAAGWARP